MDSNPFSSRYQLISNKDLIDILSQPQNYQPLALDTARTELENRNLSEPEISHLQKDLELEKTEKEQRAQKITASIEDIKQLSLSFFHKFNPFLKKAPAANYYARHVALIIGGLFLFQLTENFKFDIELLSEPAKYDASTFLYFLPLVLMSVGPVLLFKIKRAGWYLIYLYLVFTMYFTVKSIMLFYGINNSDLNIYQRLGVNTSQMLLMMELIFFGSLLWALSRKDVLKIFKVSRKNYLLISVVTLGALINIFLNIL
jgi:hypothetical protein